jgi:hypothetical protein
MKSHISEAVRADLGKLDPSHRAEIRRVAGADTQNIGVAGEDRYFRQHVDMSKKVAPARVSSPGINREPPPIVVRKTGHA